MTFGLWIIHYTHTHSSKCTLMSVPRWTAPLLLLLDSWEKNVMIHSYTQPPKEVCVQLFLSLSLPLHCIHLVWNFVDANQPFLLLFPIECLRSVAVAWKYSRKVVLLLGRCDHKDRAGLQKWRPDCQGLFWKTSTHHPILFNVAGQYFEIWILSSFPSVFWNLNFIFKN